MNNQMIAPLGYIKIKQKKSINKYLNHPNWIILQYIDTFESIINKLPTAIIVNESNCMDVIKHLPRNRKVLIIGNRPKAIIIAKICHNQKIKSWINSY